MDTFAERAIAGLASVVPSDEITFNDIDFARRQMRFVRTIPDGAPTDLGPFFDRWRELPICWGVDPGMEGVRRDSDVIGQRDLRRLDVYDVLIRPFNYTMKVSLPAPKMTSRAFLLSRVDRDYSDVERDVLALLLPHLAASYRRASLMACLSDREREILSFVAAGLTNREIGEALYLSPLTIRTHLEHIFAKLGVRTRTAAAAFAANGPGTLDEALRASAS